MARSGTHLLEVKLCSRDATEGKGQAAGGNLSDISIPVNALKFCSRV